MQLKNIVKNIVPALAIMVIGVGGAYVTYDKFFSDKVSAEQASIMEPAAGEDAAAPVADTAAPATEEAAPAMATETMPSDTAAEEAVKCMMDDKGAPIMKEDGTGCVPMMEETTGEGEGATEGGDMPATDGAAPEAPPPAAQ